MDIIDIDTNTITVDHHHHNPHQQQYQHQGYQSKESICDYTPRQDITPDSTAPLLTPNSETELFTNPSQISNQLDPFDPFLTDIPNLRVYIMSPPATTSSNAENIPIVGPPAFGEFTSNATGNGNVSQE